jgi:hypothetical protein
MYYKFSQLILNSGKRTDSVCDIFISQPDAIKEKLAGKLFIIAEIKSKRSAGLKILNFLIDNINHSYYQSDKILLREKISSLKVDHIFEAALAKVNKNFNAFLKNEKISLSDYQFNITAGILYEDNLYFAGTGNNKMFLVYKKKEQNGQGSKYLITEVKDGEDKPVNIGEKLFSSVLSGRIPLQGSFFFSNEALPEYLSQAQILSIISSLPPVSATEQLKNILSEMNAQTPFLAFTIKNSEVEKQEIRETAAIVNTRDSIIDLNKTEERTENLLAPSGLINFNKWVKIPPINLKNDDNKLGTDRLALKDKIFFKKKASNKIRRNWEIIKNFTANLSSLLFSALSKKFAKTESEQNRPGVLGNIGSVLKSKINFSLSKKSKTLLLAALIFICLFFFNTYKTKNEQLMVEQENQYAEIAAEIGQKQNHIDASLLYNNDENARKLFKEVEELMASLPEEVPDQEYRYADLKEKYKEHSEKLRKVKDLDASVLADISANDSRANPENIALLNGKIYAADARGKSVYIADLNGGIKTAIDIEKPIFELSDPVINGELIYYRNKGGVMEFDTGKESFRVFADMSENLNGATGFSIFNGKLYTLSPQKNQIYKFNNSESALGSANPWISGSADLAGARSLAIDGHIYTLAANGKALKFMRGEPVDFSLRSIEPALEDPSKIIASPDKNHLYVLEPSKNRLILYDKDGYFLSQYESDSLKDLKDFLVDEANKTFYFLNGAQILKSPIPHMN